MTLIEAMADRNLFAPWFRDAASWEAWRAFIAALFALPLTPEQYAIYQQCTGRERAPQKPATEAWLVCGRRAGKSFILALCAVFLAAFFDYRRYLTPGERGTVLIIATNSKQARVIVRYVRALLTHIPMLAKLIERETTDSFDLNNGTTIEVHHVSMKTTRGYTIVAVLADEIAFWPQEDAAEPDHEVLNALRPGMATIPNAMLLCASSPYARKGVLYDAYRKHYGKDGDILVWQAATRTMNPSIPPSLIEHELERDRAHAEAEYFAQFRTDIESFIKLDEVERCVSIGIADRPPLSGCRYRAFVDPSGGSHDSMTLAIAHKQDKLVVIDRVLERKPPFSPLSVVEQFSAILKLYRINKITGDRYAGEWPREQFRQHGIGYEVAGKSKSELYVAFLPLLTSVMVELPDQPRLIQQIVGLERRTARGGRDTVDHAPNGHDDLANVVAGVSAMFESQSRYDTSLAWVGGDELDLERQEQLRFNRYVLTGGMG